MFKEACKKNREAIYGVRSYSQISKTQVGGLGSGFAIAPGILVTVGHLVHLDNDPKRIHTNFEVIRSPDIGKQMETATLVTEDPNHDIALLKINNPRSKQFLTLEPNQVTTGTSCGSLGFPLGELTQPAPDKIQIGLIERFQGSYISAFHKDKSWSGKFCDYYEIDSSMYNGSSGCPGFLPNSNVIGMQSQSMLGNNAADNLRNADAKVRRIKGGKKPIPNSQLSISMWVPSMDIISFARHNNVYE
jgi:S1-C subfamily serine protease